MSLQASAEVDYFTLDSLMKAMQNYVSTEDYAIVKACFKSNSSENVIKLFFYAIAMNNRDARLSKQSELTVLNAIVSSK